MHEEKRCMHGARTPVSFPTTPVRVHGGAHFCTKKAAHVVIWHVYWLSTWWREDRLPRVNKQIATWRVMLKKEANHVGPTLEARLYTLEYFWCVQSTRRMRRSLLSTLSPPPTGVVARRMRWSLLTTPYARSLANACGGSQDEEKILLVLRPFTPRP